MGNRTRKGRKGKGPKHAQALPLPVSGHDEQRSPVSSSQHAGHTGHPTRAAGDAVDSASKDGHPEAEEFVQGLPEEEVQFPFQHQDVVEGEQPVPEQANLVPNAVWDQMWDPTWDVSQGLGLNDDEGVAGASLAAAHPPSLPPLHREEVISHHRGPGSSQQPGATNQLAAIDEAISYEPTSAYFNAPGQGITGAYRSQTGGQGDAQPLPDESQHRTVPPGGVPSNTAQNDVPYTVDGPAGEAYCRRTTFRVGQLYDTQESMMGHAAVERLQPLHNPLGPSIILIHGDFHSGQIWLTTPDGRPGWASFFLNKGYQVYVIDLPPHGRSFWVDLNQAEHVESAWLTVSEVENYYTAPEQNPKQCWTTAQLHNQWPGTGRRGDRTFDNYYASLTPTMFNRFQRQTMAQRVLVELLEKVGPAVLVGEGAGATAAWLAADFVPHLVQTVIAVEPSGPPFGQTYTTDPLGNKVFEESVRFRPGKRVYGIADIPLGFNPPPNPPKTVSPVDEIDNPPLNVGFVIDRAYQRKCILQCPSPDDHFGSMAKGAPQSPRRLYNLAKMRHVIITAHASFHRTFDWATAAFLGQAGVRVTHVLLEDHGIRGNGHLMFLEKNSDSVADLIEFYISRNTGPVPEATPQASNLPAHGTSSSGRESAQRASIHADGLDGSYEAHDSSQQTSAPQQSQPPAIVAQPTLGAPGAPGAEAKTPTKSRRKRGSRVETPESTLVAPMPTQTPPTPTPSHRNPRATGPSGKTNNIKLRIRRK